MNEVIGENNDKAPAIVLEISVDPEATAKLQDWEIESNVQGSLHYIHYISDLCNDIVPLRKAAREINSWLKAINEGGNDL